jgi:hypothetical protein
MGTDAGAVQVMTGVMSAGGGVELLLPQPVARQDSARVATIDTEGLKTFTSLNREAPGNIILMKNHSWFWGRRARAFSNADQSSMLINRFARGPKSGAKGAK